MTTVLVVDCLVGAVKRRNSPIMRPVLLHPLLLFRHYHHRRHRHRRLLLVLLRTVIGLQDTFNPRLLNEMIQKKKMEVLIIVVVVAVAAVLVVMLRNLSVMNTKRTGMTD